MIASVKTIFKLFNKTTRTLQKLMLVFAVLIAILQVFFYLFMSDKLVVESDPVLENRKYIYQVIDDPELQKSEPGQFVISFHKNFFCLLLGEACSEDETPSQEDLNGSILGKFSTMFTYAYSHPPASGMLWAYDGLQKSGLIPQTYAQGIGFYALQPLAPIWKMFRDLAYLLLVLVTVIIGFMIMFRAKINAQTEIAITNVLPRIVIAMILITFSFAICGFLIDLMYIFMGLGVGLVNSNLPGVISPSTGTVYNIFTEQSTGLLSDIFLDGKMWMTGGAILSLIPASLQLVLRGLLVPIAIGAIKFNRPALRKLAEGDIGTETPWIGGVLSWLIASSAHVALVSVVASVLFPYILSFIVFVTSLLIFFRVFLMLLMTYTKIILSIIFSPVILLFEAVPGNSAFSYWFKGLFFNLMTFPIVAIIVMVSGLIAKTTSSNWPQSILISQGINPDHGAGHNSLWAPPYLYSASADGFVMLVAISIIFIIPDIIAFIKKSFGVEDLPFSVTPGKLLSGAGVVGGGIAGLVMRSRSLSREFGQYHDDKSRGWSLGSIFKAKDPFKNYDPQPVAKSVDTEDGGGI